MWFFRYVGPNPIKLLKCWAKRKGCFDTWSEIFFFTVQLFFKILPTVVVEVTCTSSQRDLEKIHCVVPALLESIFCNGRTRINIKRKLRNLILLVNSFWHNIMVLHTHDLMQSESEHEKNTAAKQKRPFFLFPSFLIFHAIQSSLYVKDYDKEQTAAFYNYFKGSLLFKPQHSAWKSSKMSHLHFWYIFHGPTVMVALILGYAKR